MDSSQTRITQTADEAFQAALNAYNAAYHNHVYAVATKGMTPQRACRLQDEALALCGSPYHRIGRGLHSPAQRAYLALFVKPAR